MGLVTAVIPTRGLVYAKTLIGLRNNGITDPIIIDGLPLPECHNAAVAEGLKIGSEYIWMVEDDVEIPLGALESLLALNSQVACIDYSVRGGIGCVGYRKNKQIFTCGLGCTLIKREVFEIVPAPWFENNKAVEVSTGKLVPYNSSYGLADIYFGWKLNRAGIAIKEVTTKQCLHWRSNDVVRKEINAGQYSFWHEPLINKHTHFNW